MAKLENSERYHLMPNIDLNKQLPIKDELISLQATLGSHARIRPSRDIYRDITHHDRMLLVNLINACVTQATVTRTSNASD